MNIRNDFPPIGSKIFGGESNGLVYTATFFGTTLETSYEMVLAFLEEQGYIDFPLPKDAQELRAFLSPPSNGARGLFEEPSFSHNPLRISFVRGDRKRRKLILEIYNEFAPDHLLRFHQRQCPKREALLIKTMEEDLFEQYGNLSSY